jgi:hypothetical protein
MWWSIERRQYAATICVYYLWEIALNVVLDALFDNTLENSKKSVTVTYMYNFCTTYHPIWFAWTLKMEAVYTFENLQPPFKLHGIITPPPKKNAMKILNILPFGLLVQERGAPSAASAYARNNLITKNHGLYKLQSGMRDGS